MTTVHSKALNQSIQVDRIIGHVDGKKPGPTLIFFGGIHGNEPSGVFALQQAITKIGKDNLTVKDKGILIVISTAYGQMTR